MLFNYKKCNFYCIFELKKYNFIVFLNKKNKNNDVEWCVNGRYPMLVVVECGADVTLTTYVVCSEYNGWSNKDTNNFF